MKAESKEILEDLAERFKKKACASKKESRRKHGYVAIEKYHVKAEAFELASAMLVCATIRILDIEEGK